jgi:hypothetical protein
VEARKVRRLGRKDVSKWDTVVAGNSSIGVDLIKEIYFRKDAT